MNSTSELRVARPSLAYLLVAATLLLAPACSSDPRDTADVGATDAPSSDTSTDAQSDTDVSDIPLAVTIESPTEGAEFGAGDTVVVRATASVSEAVDATISSDVDGTLWQGTPASGGAIAAQLSGLSAGTHVVTVSVTDEEAAEASATVGLVVNGGGARVEVVIEPEMPTTTDELSATIVEPTSLEELEVSYTWSEAGGAEVSGQTLASDSTTRGESWRVLATVVDSDGTTSRATRVATIANSPPTVGGATLIPDSPLRTDTLSCAVTEWQDADNDPDQSTYAWYRSTELPDGSAGEPIRLTGDSVTRDATDLQPDDVVFCRVTPLDAESVGSPAESNDVIIDNAAPTVAAVAVISDSYRVGDPLACDVDEPSDEEGDTVGFAWRWLRNGDPIEGATAPVLSGGFAAGDAIACAVTPRDTWDDGAEVVSPLATIASTAPDVGAVVLDGGSFCSDWMCRATEVVDPDGDTSFTYTYRWLVGGVDIDWDVAILPAEQVDASQEVQCALRAIDDDGMVGAEALSMVVTAQSLAPVVDSVAVPSHGRVGDLLRCTASVSDDCTASDGLITRYIWTVDGVPVDGEHAETFSSLGLEVGAQVGCLASVDDGDQTSPPTPSPLLQLSATGWDMLGAQANAWAGYSIAVVDDRNGDGFAELALGTPNATPGDAIRAGGVMVVSGRDDVEHLDLADFDTAGLGFEVLGESGAYDLDLMVCGPFVGGRCPDLTDVGSLNSYEEGPDGAGLGFALANPGDIDNDGVSDLVVSAPYALVGEMWRGRTFVLSGAELPGGVGPAEAGEFGYVFDGECGRRVLLDEGAHPTVAVPGHDGDLAGYRVVGLGDFNGDGLGDFGVSAPNHGWTNEGTIYVVYGRTDGEQVDATDILVDRCDQDGPLEPGAFDGDAGIAIYGRRQGGGNPHRWGRMLATAGDFNGDGYDDIVVSDGGTSRYNRATLVLGGPDATSLQLQGQAPDAKYRIYLGDFERDRLGLGMPVGGGGDMNGDGFDDLVFQSVGYAGDGVANVLYGRIDDDGELAVADSADDSGRGFQLSGPEVGWATHIGASMVIGDVNGDGYDDAAIGYPDHDDESGLVLVVFGGASPPSGLTVDDLRAGEGGYVIVAAETGEGLGWALAGGDIDGDGLVDVVASAPFATGSGGAEAAGRVVVEYGRDFSALIDFYGGPLPDTLVGTEADESFVGGRGDDDLVGNGGADVFYAGEGDDRIEVGSDGFRRVDGGAGDDALALGASVTSFDLSGLRGRITDIERIVLDGQTVTLASVDVAAISVASNRLIIDGVGVVETVPGEAWRDAGVVSLGETTYLTIHIGVVELWLADTLTTRVPPTVADAPVSFDEHPADGSVAHRLAGTDPDGDSAAINWTLDDDPSGALTVDGATGDVRVTDSDRLDFESGLSRFAITVSATDASGLTTVAHIPVELLDVNEPPRFVYRRPVWRHEEGGPPGMGALPASDPDIGDAFLFSIESDPDELFDIDGATGLVSLRAGTALDFESATVHTITVRVADTVGLDDTMDVTVRVLDRDVIERTASFSFQASGRGIFEDGESSSLDTWSPEHGVELTGIDGCFDYSDEYDGVEIPFFLPVYDGELGITQVAEVSASVDLGGQICLVGQSSYDSGTWNATVPANITLNFPDEVRAGESVLIETGGGIVAEEGAFWGRTPGFGVNIGISLAGFSMTFRVCSGGDCAAGGTPGVTTGDYTDRFGMPPVEWVGEVDDSGAAPWRAVLAEPAFSSTEGFTIPWDAYAITALESLGIDAMTGTLRLEADWDFELVYQLWEYHVGFSSQNSWSFAVEANEVLGVIILEDDTRVPFVLGDTVEVPFPGDADVDGDGKVGVEVVFGLDAVFEMTRDYADAMGNLWSGGLGEISVYDPDGALAAVRSFGPVGESRCGIATVNGVSVFTPDRPCLGLTGVDEIEFETSGFDAPSIVGAIDLAEDI